MKLAYFFKRTSIRTKFIFFILTTAVIINIFIAIFYPLSISEASKKRLQERYSTHVLLVFKEIKSQKLTTDALINELLSKLELEGEVVYIASHYNHAEYILPADVFTFDKISQFKDGEIYFYKNRYLYSYTLHLKDENLIGNIVLHLGLDAKWVMDQEKQAQFYSLIIVIMSALLTYLSLFLFDKYIYIPFKKILNIFKLFSAGQENIGRISGLSQEFNQLIGYMENTALSLNELKNANQQLPEELKSAHKESQELKASLKYEIESIYNLIGFLLELRDEKSKKGIFEKISREITLRFDYSLSIFFLQKNDKLIFYNSHVRGLSVLDKKLSSVMANFVIPDQNDLYKEMLRTNPIVGKKAPFDDLVKQLNIVAEYAFIPINTHIHLYAMLVVGQMGENPEFKNHDIERLMLFANTIALYLENIDVVTNLERMVNQRTSELATTNKLLADSIEEKDTMLQLVSHDLNAPLRNVIGLIESIHRKYRDELNIDFSDRLLRIQRNVEKELKTIEDILTNFRDSELRKQYQRIDTNILINSILEELNYELRSKNIKITITKNLPEIVSIEPIVKHIFLNLIDNACKYMPNKKRGNKIEIDFEQNQNKVTFIVRDNGIGIPEERQKEIFKSYQRGIDDDGPAKGHGLGLVLVKNMVGKLGGEIHFDSQQGRGTSFYIQLKMN